MSARQAPQPGSLNLDHVAHFVPDIDAASAALESLGFTLTPFSVQSHRLQADGPLVPAGTGNRCVMFEAGYVEFLAVTGDTPIADQLHSAMRRYVGVHLIAFGTAAPELDHARLARNGFEPATPVALQRPIATETGEDIARFTVVRVPPPKMPEGRVQFCQHHTPHLVWQKRWLEHPNGATALAQVFVCVADPLEAAQRYSRYTGLALTSRPNAYAIETSRGSLTFLDPATIERTFARAPPAVPWIAGYALECRDVSATRDYLRGTGNAVLGMDAGCYAVALPSALGGIAVFQAPGNGLLRFN